MSTALRVIAAANCSHNSGKLLPVIAAVNFCQLPRWQVAAGCHDGKLLPVAVGMCGSQFIVSNAITLNKANHVQHFQNIVWETPSRSKVHTIASGLGRCAIGRA